MLALLAQKKKKKKKKSKKAKRKIRKGIRKRNGTDSLETLFVSAWTGKRCIRR